MFDNYERFDMKKKPGKPKLRLLSYFIAYIDKIKHHIKIDKSGFKGMYEASLFIAR